MSVPTRFYRVLRAALPLGILGAVALAALRTVDPRVRIPGPDPSRALDLPDVACWTGYDELGRCVGDTLAGGVHVFLVPGLTALLVCAVGGVSFGVALEQGPSWLGRISRRLMNLVESLPRLAILLMVYMLWHHNMMAVAVALGLLMVPTLAEEVAVELRALSEQDFIQFSQAHGISRARILVYHCLWLTCAPNVMRRGAFVFGYTLITDTTLSYLRGHSPSPREMSWGHQLVRATAQIFDSLWDLREYLMRYTFDPPALGHGWPQFLSVVGAILLVLWASQEIGERGAAWLRRDQRGEAAP